MFASRLPLISLLAFCLLLYGCSSEDSVDNGLTGPVGPEPGGSSTETIGLLGGDVTYGAATVIIPPGALSAPEDITVEIPLSEPEYIEPADVVQIGYVYKGSPTDLDFSLPVNIAFLYDEEDPGIYDENTLVLWTFAEAGDTLVALEDTHIDTANNSITGIAGQLAYFVLTASMEGIVTTAPSVPEPIFPYNGVQSIPLDVTFIWESTFGAISYHLQVAFDNEFNQLFYDEVGVSGTLHGITGFEPLSEYYWRLKASNTFGTSSWAEVGSFTTGDGSAVNSLDGVWNFENGEQTIMISESTYLYMESWGTLILSFAAGTFYTTGTIWLDWTHHYYLSPEIIPLGTDSVTITEKGTYTVEFNPYPIFPYDQILRMEITESNDPERIGVVEEKGFILQGDDLTLHHYDPEPPNSNFGGISYYTRL